MFHDKMEVSKSHDKMVSNMFHDKIEVSMPHDKMESNKFYDKMEVNLKAFRKLISVRNFHEWYRKMKSDETRY
jgi:hypothetical protein